MSGGSRQLANRQPQLKDDRGLPYPDGPAAVLQEDTSLRQAMTLHAAEASLTLPSASCETTVAVSSSSSKDAPSSSATAPPPPAIAAAMHELDPLAPHAGVTHVYQPTSTKPQGLRAALLMQRAVARWTNMPTNTEREGSQSCEGLKGHSVHHGRRCVLSHCPSLRTEKKYSKACNFPKHDNDQDGLNHAPRRLRKRQPTIDGEEAPEFTAEWGNCGHSSGLSHAMRSF